jgi:Domain of unknown function (DUF1929)/Bacterial Ig-like domain (group 1)/Kelch motif
MTRFQQLRFAALAAFLAVASLRCTEKVGPQAVATDIEMLEGDNQTGPVGEPLPNPLVVLVTDESGNPVEGVSVTWGTQGGTVTPATTTTGSNGRASVQRTLGPDVGEQTATASASGLTGSPVTFTSVATEGPLTGGLAITTNPPVSALTGEVFDPAAQPVVVLRDGGGNPVADAQVTASVASGGGTLEGTTTATTDANGTAAFGDLGISGTGEQTLEFTSGTFSVVSSPVDLNPLPEEASKGKWGPVIPWDIIPLHMNLLPNGKIFAWGKTDVSDTMGMPRIWDPAAGSPDQAAEIHVNEMLFCAGHVLLPNGNLMVAGGHHMDDAGIKVTYFFSQDGVPTKGPDMSNGRWYPTLTVLPDGDVLTMAGRNEAGEVVRTPELWNGVAWSQLTGAGTLEIPYYPRNFVDPKNGLVFYAGERVMSRWFNVAGTGSWSNGPTHIWPFNRDYGTAVMYDTGKILYAGGGGHTSWPTPDAKSPTPTATAETIDLNQTSPTWQSVSSMSAPRRHLNSTVLPDGQVLVTGGTRGAGFVNIDPGLAVKEAEVWNPGTGQWTTLAANQVMRVYHSVSLLLPNGTVLHGASGDALAIQPGGGIVPVPSERNHEIFSPPYLFKGARPTITSVGSTSVSYGGTIAVTTPNAAQITAARWIRLGSVTHAFDMGQRANTLTFTRTANGLSVNVPANPNQAPPGYYMLFILNRNGVPSAGSIVRVQ